MIREILTDHITGKVPHDKVAVLLSGGVDSISVAIAAQDAGKTVHAYSFHLEGQPSYDHAKAKEVAEIMGWEFTTIIVPTDNLVEDWHRLVKHGCRKKSHYEAAVFPFLYCYENMSEKFCITGWGADAYFGCSKKAMIRYSSFKKKRNYVKYCKEHNQKRINWNEFRNAYLDGDCAGLQQHTNLAEKHGKVHVTPYLDPRIREFFMKFSWEELNKPKQKNIIRAEFNIEELFGKVKPHINLQLGSGIDKLFETLLDNPEINYKRRQRVMDLCRDWHSQNTTFDLSDFMS